MELMCKRFCVTWMSVSNLGGRLGLGCGICTYHIGINQYGESCRLGWGGGGLGTGGGFAVLGL